MNILRHCIINIIPS
ncbi:hypothetical protein CISIN_1g0440142mg, partial [Citrus sinensis]